jgi:predicted ATPase
MSASEPRPDDIDIDARRPEAWARRVRIRNFRSIAYCDVELKPFTVLVGGNGSGKSNLLLALKVMADAVRTRNLASALDPLGGFVGAVWNGAPDRSTILLEIEIAFRDGGHAKYGFELGHDDARGLHRVGEWLSIEGEKGPAGFRIEGDERKPFGEPDLSSVADVWELDEKAIPHLNSLRFSPPAQPNELYLVTAAGLPEVWKVLSTLLGMAFYDFHPDMMRSPYAGVDDLALRPDGSNITVVLDRLKQGPEPRMIDRALGYLPYMVPDFVGVEIKRDLPYRFLEGRFARGESETHTVPAFGLSSGTLRALGSLVAVTQHGPPSQPITLVAIEEPEMAIHPAAVAALVDAFDEATLDKQVIITTHSSDLLNHVDFDEHQALHQVLAVEMTPHGTAIGPIDWASRETIKDRLYTPGELLRSRQFSPEVPDSDVEDMTPAPTLAGP